MDKSTLVHILLFIGGGFFTFMFQVIWEMIKLDAKEKKDKFKKELIEEITKTIKS